MCNFNLVKSEKIDDINSVGYVYDHSCGLRLIYIENDDIDRVFSIAFRTLPESDCGLAHIMEHSVLCGSENYRLKDPFNLLDKGSIHTYLNALTYEDKTLYPVASTNESDFRTLIRVYLDAVFRPLIYQNEGIFRQEGWHSDGSTVNGVVLNEMKGVMSSPVRVLDTAVNRELFKGCGYQYYSGGIPESIPKLTYEDFLDFHRQKYHPSNAVMYLYGKIEIKEYLDLIDSEFLNGYDYCGSDIKKQYNIQKSNDVTISFPSKGKNILMFANCFNTVENFKECLAAEIVCDVLCESEGAPIREAIISEGIGTSISADFDDTCFLPCFQLCVEGSDEKDTERLKSVIADTMRNIKIDRKRIQGVINRIRFFYKEQNFGYKPKGLYYNIILLKSFLYGSDSFDPIRLDKLIAGLDNYDWEGLAHKMFTGGCFGILRTSKDENKADIPVPPVNDAPLIEYRKFEDTSEEQDKIKTVPVSEIGRKAEYYPYDEFENGIYVPIDEKGIVFASVMFDTSSLSRDELSILGVYKYIIDLYDVEKYAQIDYYMGDFDCSFTTFKTDGGFKPCIVFDVKCLSENTPKSMDILNCLIHLKFSDIGRIKQLMDEYREDIRLSYSSSSAGSKSYRRALSGISDAYAYTEYVSGVDFYFALKNMTAEQFSNGIERIVDKLFTKKNMFYSFTCCRDEKNMVKTSLKCVYNSLADRGADSKIYVPNLNTANTAIVSEADVNFNSAAFKLDCKSGVRKVVKQIISREYMWDNIRLIGGAYGGNTGFLWGSLCYLYSYRDPQVQKTYDSFEALGRYLSDIKLSQKDVDRFIIGAVNEDDMPVKNGILNSVCTRLHFSGTGEDLLNQRRCEMLDTKLCQISEFGDKITTAYENAVKVTVGNYKSVKKYGKFEEFLQID